jgi:type I restriction enzyme S subunit
MTSECWRSLKVKELGTIVTGQTPPTKDKHNFGQGYLFIKPSDLSESTRSIVATETEITKAGLKTLPGRLVPPRSTCVVTIGSIGKKMGLTSLPSVTNQAINSVVVDQSSYDPWFVYYVLRYALPQVKQLDSGTTSGRENVSKSSFENVELRAPSITIQRKIASILSVYDDLIENNLRRIKILEEMAQNLYREWFVKFRFPGHQQATFIDSPLGSIPEGWEVKRLDQVALFQNNKTDAGTHLSDRIYLPIDCIPRKSLAISETRSWEEAQSSLHLFDEGDILFGAMRPYFHKVVVAPFKGVTRKTCFVFKSVLPAYHAFTALTLFQDSTVSFANAHSKGATMPYAVWPQSLDGMPVVVPPIKNAERFEDAVGPVLARMGTMFFQNTALRRTRDLLLPKLISGEVDVGHIAPYRRSEQ